jgi:hypothetical protein
LDGTSHAYVSGMTDKQISDAIKRARKLVVTRGDSVFGASLHSRAVSGPAAPFGDKVDTEYRRDVPGMYRGEAKQAVIKALACRMLGFDVEKCARIARDGYCRASLTAIEIASMDGAI